MEENVILQCEDSFAGILTGIYEAYALRLPHEKISLQIGELQELQLFSAYRTVKPDAGKAQKVDNTLRRRFTKEDYEGICLALASPFEKKAQAVYQTVVWGLGVKGRKNVLGHLTNDSIRTVMELARRTENELKHLRGFLRFDELEGGVLYGVIRPQNDILVPLTEHFADRLPGENFLIYDEGRNRIAVHPKGKAWFLMQGETEIFEERESMKFSADNEFYQELFCSFCHTIGIETRKNLKLQQNMLPLRFRPYMVELTKRERCI